MTIRKPLVFGADGLPQQLQAGDTLGINAKFTGSITIPAMILGGYASASMTATPAVAGDALAAGEAVLIQPAAALPAGVTAQYGIVTTTNTVTIYFTSNALLAVATAASLTLIAQR